MIILKAFDDGETPDPNDQGLSASDGDEKISRKKLKSTRDGKFLLFERLHDDLVISILCKLSSTAECPSDFISVGIRCKSMNALSCSAIVLAKIIPENIVFYCLGLDNRRIGCGLVARAAKQSHAAALYSLAVIKLNGSGAADHIAGAKLCCRAASLGHINAIREFGHCL
ncbi:hypothetical protein GIB67_009350 [Kingdonia uniflora]|uniref:Uncharacterized protein n=1 Tax=Kingdonia uniflora TaxID=39325 RepID=A0A7J7N2P1_9MAGN|nr:hypothetical protein GIB67_009350 [Kingdonia uniflora]